MLLASRPPGDALRTPEPEWQMILAVLFELGSSGLPGVWEASPRRTILEELVVASLAAVLLLIVRGSRLPLGCCLGLFLAQPRDEDLTARIMMISMRSYRRCWRRTHWPGRMKPEYLGFLIRILAT